MISAKSCANLARTALLEPDIIVHFHRLPAVFDRQKVASETELCPFHLVNINGFGIGYSDSAQVPYMLVLRCAHSTLVDVILLTSVLHVVVRNIRYNKDDDACCRQHSSKESYLVLILVLEIFLN